MNGSLVTVSITNDWSSNAGASGVSAAVRHGRNGSKDGDIRTKVNKKYTEKIYSSSLVPYLVKPACVYKYLKNEIYTSHNTCKKASTYLIVM